DASGHTGDSECADLSRELGQPAVTERRIAVTLKEQVAGPDRPLEVSPAEHVRLDAIGRTELRERRVRDEQFLVRGLSERERFVPREDRRSCREVEGDTS